MKISVSRLQALMLAFLLLVLIGTLPPEVQAARSGDVVTIRNDAPQEYVVVKGDTLWDISGRFLEKPWLWPEIWELNPQIEDPHWIYPGDIIGLIYVDGKPMLTINRSGRPNGLELVKLKPEIRREAIKGAIPAISYDEVASLLSNNSILSMKELESSPYILQSRDHGTYASDQDIVFARGEWTPGVSLYDIVRPGMTYKKLKSGELLGVEGILVGTATMLLKEEDQGTLRVDDALIEVRKGDLLIPKQAKVSDSNFFPAAPSFDVDGNVLGIHSKRTIGGNFDSLVLSLGRQDHINTGHLLTVQKENYEVEDTNLRGFTLGKNKNLNFAGEKFARVMVYKVFENSSLALVLNSEDVIRVNDRIVTP